MRPIIGPYAVQCDTAILRNPLIHKHIRNQRRIIMAMSTIYVYVCKRLRGKHLGDAGGRGVPSGDGFIEGQVRIFSNNQLVLRFRLSYV